MLRLARDAVGLVVGEDVDLGEEVRFGAHVSVGPGTVVGDECVVEDGVVLGKVARLARTSMAVRAEAPEPLVLGGGVTVCTGAVVYAGARVGARAILGDQAQVRERAVVGADSVIGRGATVDNDVVLGERVRVQTLVYLAAYSTVEDDVFVGPGVVTTNDHTMMRHPRDQALLGVTLRRACRVGGGAVLTPGLEVGEEAFVAAGALVTRDVPARAVVMGVPARAVREVSDEDLVERWRR
ncbi:MAG: DapH/DapD/GlmU-related protein [Solirubrobacteraceae bacterium]